MRFVFAFVIVGLLLAGCTSAPSAVRPQSDSSLPVVADPFHPLNGSAVPKLDVPKPGEVVRVAQPGFAEPNIAAGYDGKTLYVGNPGGVWRSDDAGKSWVKPANEGLEGGGDGDVAVDRNGTVYYLGLFGAKGRTIPFMSSRNGGESWSPAVDLAEGKGSDREWIDVTPDSQIFATWRGEKGIEFNGSLDGGASWIGRLTVGPDGDGGNIAHDPVTGALAVAVADFAEMAGVTQPVLHVYVSTDQGHTWTDHPAAKLPRSSPVEPNGYATDFPILAFDGAGTLYLAYSADASGFPEGTTPPEELARYGTFLQASHDLGATWSPPRLLSDPSKDARFPWVAAGAPGRIAVVWYENVRGTPGEMVPDEWFVKLYESLDADQAAPHGVTATMTTAPTHTGALCTSGTGCLAADRSMLDFFEVAIGLDGQPVIAFAASKVGTGVGVAVEKTDIRFVRAEGASLL